MIAKLVDKKKKIIRIIIHIHTDMGIFECGGR